MFHDDIRDNYPQHVKGKSSPFIKGPKSLYYSDMKTFRDALLDEIETTGISLNAVANGAGVSYEQLKKLKQGKSQSTNVEDARKVSSFFGKTLDEFLGSPAGSSPHRLTELYSQLSEEKRLRLEGYLEALSQE